MTDTPFNSITRHRNKTDPPRQLPILVSMLGVAEWIDTRSPEWSNLPSPRIPGSACDPGKMKVGYFGNEFPHDDLKDLLRGLHVHTKDLRYTTLARFIREATLAIRDEVRLLPTILRVLVPPFETIFNLADHGALRNGPLAGAIDGVLLCAVQLAAFIG